jgi:hypothetical protein
MIIACPPVLKEKQLEIGIVKFMPCPGATEETCQVCKTPVWIGPRQLEYADRNPKVAIMCAKCAILATGGKPVVNNLGGQGSSYLIKRDPP